MYESTSVLSRFTTDPLSCQHASWMHSTSATTVVVEGFEEFEVEEILDSRIHYNKLQYFVDWKGYKPHDCTWEPAEFLKHAKNAVAHFHTHHPNWPSPKDIPRRGRRFALSLFTILPTADTTPNVNTP